MLDLHLDTFIWQRIFGYDLARTHRGGPLGRAFLGHTDLPRAIASGLTGGTWVITTNPFRPSANREATFFRNLAKLKAILAAAESRVVHVRTLAKYVEFHRVRSLAPVRKHNRSAGVPALRPRRGAGASMGYNLRFAARFARDRVRAAVAPRSSVRIRPR